MTIFFRKIFTHNHDALARDAFSKNKSRIYKVTRRSTAQTWKVVYECKYTEISRLSLLNTFIRKIPYVLYYLYNIMIKRHGVVSSAKFKQEASSRIYNRTTSRKNYPKISIPLVIIYAKYSI